MSSEPYPDTHPDVRDHLVRVSLPGQSQTQNFMPLAMWQEAVAERDEWRRLLALIAAEWWAGTRDPQQIEMLLRKAGETPESARAMAELIAWARRPR